MLTTRDLNKLLRKVKWYGGTFPCDMLPKYIKKPKSFIINLDPSYKTGSHWVALHFDTNNQAHYFDSFGRNPPDTILSFIDSNSNYLKVNRYKYQGNSSIACGFFCILFILLVHDLNRFYRIFRKCKHIYNEKKVLKTINELI